VKPTTLASRIKALGILLVDKSRIAWRCFGISQQVASSPGSRRLAMMAGPFWSLESAVLYFKQVLDERCGCASYVIASRKTREAAVIDPAIDTEPYEALLRERDFRLRYVVDTHMHADHVFGARRLAVAHEAELCLHEAAQVTYPFRPLRDGSELELGQLRGASCTRPATGRN
jgi:glyoxylase-like metal-dependent hydrolase (beta-lactamase superfamily II)